MTDLYLAGVFLFCVAAGYLAVSKGGEFLEQNLFRDPQIWYTGESGMPYSEEEAGGYAASRDIVSKERTPRAKGLRAFEGFYQRFLKTGVPREKLGSRT